ATQRFSIIEVGLNGGHHHAGINRDQVKTRELEAYPGVNDDAFVQYAIQDIKKAGATRLVFDDHGAAPERTSISAAGLAGGPGRLAGGPQNEDCRTRNPAKIRVFR